MMNLDWQQIVGLFVLAVPIACVARTVVNEEIFREPRDYCKRLCDTSDKFIKRKFFYLFTCEYCFSHYVTLAALLVTRYRLMYDDWRGYGVAFFSLVFVANVYLSLYSRLRVDITSERMAADVKAKEAHLKELVIEQVKKDRNDDNAELISNVLDSARAETRDRATYTAGAHQS